MRMAKLQRAANTYPGGFCELLFRTIVENTLLRGFAPYDIWSGDLQEEAEYDFPLDLFLFMGFHTDGSAQDFHVELFGGREA